MKLIHVNDDKSLEEYNEIIPNTKAIVLFYMDGCMHCEMMKDEWMDFENKMKQSDEKLIIARVNQKYINRITGDKDILGFPTIFYLMNGKKIKEYNGDRTINGFNEFYKSIINKSQKGGKRKKTIKRKQHSKYKKHSNYKKSKKNNHKKRKTKKTRITKRKRRPM